MQHLLAGILIWTIQELQMRKQIHNLVLILVLILMMTDIQSFIEKNNYSAKKLNEDELIKTVSKLIAEEKVIGWFDGRMEFGPRALGARSIIGDARSPKMQALMNIKIKFREGFRPFAPSVLYEKVREYFEIEKESPYMLLVADVKKERRVAMSE